MHMALSHGKGGKGRGAADQEGQPGLRDWHSQNGGIYREGQLGEGQPSAWAGNV